MANFEVKGFAELEKLLKDLPDKVSKKVVVGGLRVGANLLVKGMKQRVPVKTGKLRDSITVSSAVKNTRNRSNVVIGFKKPTSRRVHLTEFGTEHSHAEPFIRPTLDEDGEAAILKIGENMGKGVEREAGKFTAR